MRLTLGLVDTVFAHDRFMVAGIDSSKIAWDRRDPFRHKKVVFSHEMMFSESRLKVPKSRRIGLLYESRAIVPKTYELVRRVANDFEVIFTHDESLLREFSNTRWIPGSGVWIGGRQAPGVVGIQPKEKLVSMLSSRKTRCALHIKRLLIATRLKVFAKQVDVFIQGLSFSGQISPLQTLSEYRYSIVMENFIGNGYFTEKILNCFATGTVPIYLGAPDINKYFDPNGILRFNSHRELVRDILPVIGQEDYLNRMSSIRVNYLRSQEYGSIEDFIAENYEFDIFP